SRSVDKEQFTRNIQDIEEEQMDIEDPAFVFGGSLVVQGEGFVEVVKTGADTKYGEIGDLVQSIDEGQNRLQKELQSLVKKLFVFSFILTLSIFIVVLFDTGAQLSDLLTGDVSGFFASGDVVQALLLALTMAIASIPEELPVVFSVFLIIGARKIAKQKALVRNMTSIESLGSANVICVDKTGTLTEGSLAVHSVYTGGELFEREETQGSDTQVRTFMERAVLAGERYSADPIETANKEYAKALDIDIDE
ncbi:MAG: HAD-IC family P-type ATPase, partial [Candidatus Paceibacteria bacterium]